MRICTLRPSLRLIFPLAVAAVIGTACGGSSSLRTQDARSRLDDIQATALADEEFSFLDVCPVEGWVDLVTDSLAAVDGPILADSLSGQRFVATARNEAIGVDWISCEFNGDGDGSAGLLFGPSPVDFESYANDYADVAVNDVQLTLGEATETSGGTMNHACGAFGNAPRTDYCAATWFDQNLLVELFIRGEGAATLDVESMRTALTERIESIVDEVAER